MNVIEIIEQLVRLYCEVEATKLTIQSHEKAHQGDKDSAERLLQGAEGIRNIGKKRIKTHNFH